MEESDEVMLITNGGTLVRTKVAEVSVIGRNTQGVKVIGVSKGEHLISVEKVDESEEEEVDSIEGSESAEGSQSAGGSQSAEGSESEESSDGDDET